MAEDEKESGLNPMWVTFALLIVVGIAGACFGGSRGEESDKGHVGAENFSSVGDLRDYVQASPELALVMGVRGLRPISHFRAGPRLTRGARPLRKGVPEAGGKAGHSTTNVQVEGVGEADIVKNDGEFIYAVSGSEVAIVRAYPPRKMEVVSEIEAEEDVIGMYLGRNRLVVLGQERPFGSIFEAPGEEEPRKKRSRPSGGAFAIVYDISDRSDPTRIAEVSLSGRYFDSRKIGRHVYLVSTSSVKRENVLLPKILSNGSEEEISPPHIHHFEPQFLHYKFTSVISLDVQEGKIESRESYLTGRTQNLYVSTGNIYITGSKRIRLELWKRVVENVVLPALPDDLVSDLREVEKLDASALEKRQRIRARLNGYLGCISEEERSEITGRIRKGTRELWKKIEGKKEKTAVRKIAIEGGKIDYAAAGEIPGRVLNRFSMSEHRGYFRIATTTGYLARSLERATAANHVYILDDDLDIVGRLENIAPNEEIYSARFMGDKCYLVTFRKVDPLFVLDLSKPSNPEVLGRLKITGYSDYLHPYDENCLIGIGKSTEAAESGEFSWYQGVKVSLFDVRNVEEPKQLAKTVIGDRGTESLALREPHAFLFDRSRHLLSFPVTVAEIDENQYAGEIPPNERGKFVWQGAYVFNISPDQGVGLRGRVTHVEDEEVFKKSGFYFRSDRMVRRILYIGDVLYTYSKGAIKANDIGDMRFLSAVDIGE